MTYLGYTIHVRGVHHDGKVSAEISSEDDSVAIEDSDYYSAEETAREIVDYATGHNIKLDVATKYVLC